tara:strand:+ start:551 stop:901 length:351 start_codon:yes stop_codon:yes gene_type:complete
MQKIMIDNIKVFGYHGVYDSEREQGQYFNINIIYNYDYNNPNDEIENVKDYTEIINYFLDEFNSRKFHLLEELIHYLSSKLKQKFKLDYLKISITKKIAVKNNKINITIEQEASDG